ncbi:MAG: hypothetical protein WD847_11605 [Pirellulales bacterium]
MFRPLSLSVAMALLAGLPQLKAADPPATPSPDAKQLQPAPETSRAVDDLTPVFRAVRIVRDLAEFDILNLKPHETGAWIVAGILPGGLSGGLYMQGGYIKAETGEFVDNGVRPSLVIQVGGQWELLELLSGQAPREGRFQWKEPHVEHSFDRNFNIYDTYSVFTSPKTYATVICTFYADRKGAEQFSSVTSIPGGWKTFVKPAYEYHVGHSADFAGSHLNGLRKLAAGENPFIALTAIRHLLRRSTSEEETDQFVDLARSLPKFRQAVLTFWLLKRNDDNARDILLRAISRSKSAAELTGMALGMESWTASQERATFLFDPGSTGNLRDQVIQRWQRFDPSPVDEESWKSWHKILAAPGIQEGKSRLKRME